MASIRGDRLTLSEGRRLSAPRRLPDDFARQRGRDMSTVARPWAPHVLIVDDNRHFADSLSRLLEVWNFQPLVAYDGPSAVSTALTQAPDAILLDIDLPGLKCYAVAQYLRSKTKFERTKPATKTRNARKAERQHSS